MDTPTGGSSDETATDVNSHLTNNSKLGTKSQREGICRALHPAAKLVAAALILVFAWKAFGATRVLGRDNMAAVATRVEQPQELRAGDFSSPAIPMDAEKRGAGLFILAESEPDKKLHGLLLFRNSKHNDKTWGLPGGNLDNGESFGEAALREAAEELGHAPPATVLGSIITRRGKKDKKVYTVFVAKTTAEVMRSYKPELDTKEHSDWRWIPLSDMQNMKVPLHPVVELVVHNEENNAALQSLLSKNN